MPPTAAVLAAAPVVAGCRDLFAVEEVRDPTIAVRAASGGADDDGVFATLFSVADEPRHALLPELREVTDAADALLASVAGFELAHFDLVEDRANPATHFVGEAEAESGRPGVHTQDGRDLADSKTRRR